MESRLGAPFRPPPKSSWPGLTRPSPRRGKQAVFSRFSAGAAGSRSSPGRTSFNAHGVAKVDQTVVPLLAGFQFQLDAAAESGRPPRFDQRAAVRRPVERGRDEQAQFVDEAGREERRVDAASPLECEAAAAPSSRFSRSSASRKINLAATGETM